ncbi:PAS domain S-box protein [Patescibacteria group bacterium]|nr:MAG: PAS domain S-box protein [Patescibacteria group bacterium]
MYRVPTNMVEFQKAVDELKSIFNFLDRIPRHIIITDANANVLYASRKVAAGTGFERDEILMKNPADLWGGHMEDPFYEAMWQRIKEDKKSFFGIVKNKRKDGEFYYLELYILPITDNEGNVKYFMGIEFKLEENNENETLEELAFLSKLLALFKNGACTVEKLKSVCS